MKTLKLQNLAPALLGAAAISTLSIPQAAEAGIVKASGEVDFTNVVLELDGVDLLTGGSIQTTSTAFIDGTGGTPGFDISTCPGTADASTAVVDGLSMVSVASSVDCAGPISSATVDASLMLLQGDDEVGQGAAANNSFTVFFDALAGEEIVFSADFTSLITAEVSGFAGADNKVSTVDFANAFVINDINGNVIFSGPPLNDSLAIIDQNLNLSSPLSIPGLSIAFEIPVDGEYQVSFTTELSVGGVNNQVVVPEPSSLLGLAAIAGLGAFARKRRS